jgi:excisionase family DNA binding protein
MAQSASAARGAPSRPASETVSVDVAAARLGLSRSKAYELAGRNALGVPCLRFGRAIRIPVRALDRLLWAEPRPEAVERAQPGGAPNPLPEESGGGRRRDQLAGSPAA